MEVAEAVKPQLPWLVSTALLLEEISLQIYNFSKKVKVVQERNWDGQHISEDQPLLLTGGSWTPY